MGMLDPLGVGLAAERLYVNLVEEGAASPAELARRCDLLPTQVHDLVDSLLDLGLVRSQPPDRTAGPEGGTLIALPAATVLERDADQHARAARQAADLARELSSWWSRHHSGVGYADFLRSGDACRAAESSLLSSARTELLSLTNAPRREPEPGVVEPGPVEPAVSPAADDLDKVPADELTSAYEESRRRGVESRAVYEQELLRSDAVRHAIVDRARLGEQARVVSRLPVSLTVADREIAVVGYPATRRDEFHSLLVRPSGLLDLLLQTFEIFWGLGVALPDTAPGADEVAASGRHAAMALEREDHDLLRHLVLGVTDQAIAREMGISTRTVTRRVSRLQERLGVSTRFQLGVRAVERGLL